MKIPQASRDRYRVDRELISSPCDCSWNETAKEKYSKKRRNDLVATKINGMDCDSTQE